MRQFLLSISVAALSSLLMADRAETQDQGSNWLQEAQSLRNEEDYQGSIEVLRGAWTETSQRPRIAFEMAMSFAHVDADSTFHWLRIVQKHVQTKLAKGETLREAAALIAVSDGRHNAKNSVPIDRIEDKLDRLDLDNSIVHAVVLGGKDSKLMYLLAKYGAGRYIVVPQR